MGWESLFLTVLSSARFAWCSAHAPHSCSPHVTRSCQGYDLELAARCRTIREFDAAITTRSFGWPGVDEYYAGSGSDAAVPHVAVPLLAIQALDDPIAPAEAIPYEVRSLMPVSGV
jgi:predicted alpha/beta-fold hydrolase